MRPILTFEFNDFPQMREFVNKLHKLNLVTGIVINAEQERAQVPAPPAPRLPDIEYIHRKEVEKKEPDPGRCENCGKPLDAKAKGRFCSNECAATKYLEDRKKKLHPAG